jgi:hypothetical protein
MTKSSHVVKKRSFKTPGGGGPGIIWSDCVGITEGMSEDRVVLLDEGREHRTRRDQDWEKSIENILR